MKNIVRLDPKLKTRAIADVVHKPIIIYINKFDEPAAKEFNTQFSLAHETGQEIIPIVIDSYGGQVYSLLAMVDTVKSSNLPIATINLGKSMSCGSLLFSFGSDGYRFCAPNATFMIHDVATGVHGKIEEVKADTKEAERLNEHCYKLMAKNCGKEERYFLNLIHEKSHADWYLSAEEAQKHNLVNHIKIPSFITEVSVKTTFG